MRTKEFVAFITEREHAREQKDAGNPKPWTKDKILQKYRFCNVHREDDKVTRWIADNWRAPMHGRGDLWFWMLVARLVNLPSSLELMTRMALTNRWSAKHFIGHMEEAYKRNDAAWSGAYIVSTNGVPMPKATYIAQYVLDPAWQVRKTVRPRIGDTLQEFCRRLLLLNGLKGFIAGQVIADAKYDDPTLALASDWHTFAVSGPGSRRGLNRVVGRALREPWKEQHWHGELIALREASNGLIPPWWEPLHAQDVQNCLCEFDKYERARLGEGRPRSTYPGEA